MSVEPIAPYHQPLRKSVTVARPLPEAFEVFTAGIGRWWPLGRYSIHGPQAVSCAIEPRVGGALYEVRDDGARFPWGRVLAWDAPHRVVFTWHPGREPDTAQEVEVRFRAEGESTRVDLEHRGWQTLGERAAEIRERYHGGWPEVLGAFVKEGEGRQS
jgi:uncharacterized protein YndB with AHSA1/START domain